MFVAERCHVPSQLTRMRGHVSVVANVVAHTLQFKLKSKPKLKPLRQLKPVGVCCIEISSEENLNLVKIIVANQ